MAEALVAPQRYGPARWLGAAALIGIGFLMLYGIGSVLVGAGVIWAVNLGVRRMPGLRWGIGLLVLFTIALLIQWEIF